MEKKFSKLRFKEFAQMAAVGGVVALPAVTADATPVAVGSGVGKLTIHAGNAIWHLNNAITFSTTSSAWAFSEGSLNTAATLRKDAFDGVLSWHVNPGGNARANAYRSPNGTIDVSPYPIVASTGTTVTGAPQTLAGLTVTGQIYFSPVKAVARSMLILQNPSASPITVTVVNNSNRGSDANTTHAATSSGDATVDNTDNWFVSYQGGAPGANQDPVLTFAYNQTGSAVRGTSTPLPTNGSDKFNIAYTVTVPAGATRRLILFVQMSDTTAHATSDASLFNSRANLDTTDYLSGLSQAQLDEVVNWNLAAVAPPTPLAPTEVPGLGPLATLSLGALLTLLAARRRPLGWRIRRVRNGQTRP